MLIRGAEAFVVQLISSGHARSAPIETNAVSIILADPWTSSHLCCTTCKKSIEAFSDDDNDDDDDEENHGDDDNSQDDDGEGNFLKLFQEILHSFSFLSAQVLLLLRPADRPTDKPTDRQTDRY